MADCEQRVAPAASHRRKSQSVGQILKQARIARDLRSSRFDRACASRRRNSKHSSKIASSESA
jgi:hypothetical protein